MRRDTRDTRAFIEENHGAVMATLAQGGGVHLAPVMVSMDQEGRITVSSREGAILARNIGRDQRVWLCILQNEFFGDWIRIDGNADVVPAAEAVEFLVDHYRRIGGEHEDWDRYRAAMLAERRVLIRITIERVGPDIVA